MCPRIILPVIVALLSFETPRALAAVTLPEGDPRERIAHAYDLIAQASRAATDQEKLLAEVTGVFDDIVDYHGFSKRTLKGTWSSLKPAQHMRFMGAFKGLIMSTYAKRFQPGVAFEVSYRGDTVFEEGDAPQAWVHTTVHGTRAAVDVSYLFAPAGKKSAPHWAVTDIVIDEVSMARNWRKQFTRIIERDGFRVLIKKIEAKAKRR